jgi:hypothetical protein
MSVLSSPQQTRVLSAPSLDSRFWSKTTAMVSVLPSFTFDEMDRGKSVSRDFCSKSDKSLKSSIFTLKKSAFFPVRKLALNTTF